MLTDWKKWCRLCANDKATLKFECVQDLNIILSSIFDVSIYEIDDLLLNICEECCTFVNKLEHFKERCEQTNRLLMYLSKCSGTDSELFDIQEIRSKYLGEHDTHYETERLGEHLDAETQELLNINALQASQNIEENVKEEDNTEVFYKVESMTISPNQHELEMLDMEMEECSNEPDANADSDASECSNDPDYDDGTGNAMPNRTLKPHRTNARAKESTLGSSVSVDKNNQQKTRSSLNKSASDVLYQCELCFKAFSSPNYLKKHETTHLADDEKLLFPCHLCSKMFSKSVNVKAHIRLVHEGEKPFICEECGKPFGSRGALKEHFIVHTEETPFQCSHCQKRFKNAARLKTHEDTHNNTLYVCPHCGMKLNTKRTLNMHMVVHSDQKKYKCYECGNEYKRSKALKAHLILHTGLRPYQCPFCDRSFTNGSNCRSHKKKFHPHELAALEASGGQKPASNIPKLEHLQRKFQGFEVVELTKKSKVRAPSKTPGKEKHHSNLPEEPTHLLPENIMTKLLSEKNQSEK